MVLGKNDANKLAQFRVAAAAAVVSEGQCGHLARYLKRPMLATTG